MVNSPKEGEGIRPDAGGTIASGLFVMLTKDGKFQSERGGGGRVDARTGASRERLWTRPENRIGFIALVPQGLSQYPSSIDVKSSWISDSKMTELPTSLGEWRAQRLMDRGFPRHDVCLWQGDRKGEWMTSRSVFHADGIEKVVVGRDRDREAKGRVSGDRWLDTEDEKSFKISDVVFETRTGRSPKTDDLPPDLPCPFILNESSGKIPRT